MQGAIIANKDSLTYLYINENNGIININGISVQNDKVIKTNDNILNEISNYFILGKNRELIGRENEYDIFLDKDTNLKHFIKDNIENIDMLFNMNGTDALLYLLWNVRLDKQKSTLRKFKIRSNTFYISLYFLTILFLINLIPEKTGIYINGEIIDIHNGISYVTNFSEEDRFKEPITIDMIREYIFTTNRINNIEVKYFLFNEELLNKILPYYDGTPLSIISRIRHENIGIIPFDENDREREENGSVGYYQLDNNLHVKDFNENNFDRKSSIAKTLAHEYIHLLQTYDGYPFVKETIAELLAREFYLNEATSTKTSYHEACKCIKILMEIIGPNPLLDNAFHQGSTMIEDEVSKYLSDEELKEFIGILELSPYHDKDLIDYDRLYELLGIIYMNKFNTDINDDLLIYDIKNDKTYIRAYFNDELMNVSCYVKNEIKEMSLEEAVKLRYISFIKNEVFTLDEFKIINFKPIISSYSVVFSENVLDSSDIHISGNNIIGSLILKDGRQVDANTAVNMGYAKLICRTTKEVTLEEYLDGYKNNKNYEIISNFPDIVIDLEGKSVKYNENITCDIPSINVKFLENTIKLS